MSKLFETFDWAAGLDNTALSHAVRSARFSPLRAVGSGGSLTAAHALAGLHQVFAGQLAAVATPLQVVNQRLAPAVSSWLLTAAGRNVDVLAAAQAEIEREPKQVSVVCGSTSSPLADLCRDHPFVDLITFDSPQGKDGFLATNSLLSFVTLISRAYVLEFASPEDWAEQAHTVRALLMAGNEGSGEWRQQSSALWSRETIVVLHGPATAIGAIDVESKFTEAALANVQIADYRNFAHGRHHWLAKRSDRSGVLAFVSDTDRSLAERTLDLIPDDVPVVRIDLPGGSVAAGLKSLIVGMWLTGWAGAALGIDPGRPGVPEFGRKLYHLNVRTARAKDDVGISIRTAAALRRKTGLTVSQLMLRKEASGWLSDLELFQSSLDDAEFGAVVLDYDGTIVDTRRRFHPPEDDVSAELIRIVESGGRIAIATGRGSSVRRDLQRVLPESLWSRILIGYYNGAEIASLDDDAAPRSSETCDTELEVVSLHLRADTRLLDIAEQHDRPHQITLTARTVSAEEYLWGLVQQIVAGLDTRATVTRSSHSVDVVAPGVSKINVLTRLRSDIGDHPILTIGDRGRWPGNDYELLNQPFSLSVDEVSAQRSACWNLASPGQRGPRVTVEYLRAVSMVNGWLSFAGQLLR